jgi:3,4-dihydroxy 2-butanone 4-phosphate synthase / GTP cyclohydrolase II
MYICTHIPAESGTHQMDINQLAVTQLPTVHGIFKMIAFDSGIPDFPHFALWNELSAEITNVRVHSECVTGDVFGSVRCDCGEQLDAALSVFGAAGGMLIYLRQEGRGIGIVNKMKAYNLQDEGMDTVDANLALGFHADSRDYTPAIAILKHLNIDRINLFTNNPEKVSAFDESGIEVVGRKPVEIDVRIENEAYLRAKKFKMGHFLDRF